MDSKPIFKRVKERSVWEAKESVDQWRKLFEQGIQDQAGKTTKLTLKQAAEYVGIPKKTLEDYHQLLRKVSKITSLQNLKDKKMGYLRQFLKESKQYENQTEENHSDYVADIDDPQQADFGDEGEEEAVPSSFHYDYTQLQNQQTGIVVEQTAMEIEEKQIDVDDMIVSGEVNWRKPDWDDALISRLDDRNQYASPFCPSWRDQQQPCQQQYQTPYVNFVLIDNNSGKEDALSSCEKLVKRVEEQQLEFEVWQSDPEDED